MGRTVRTVWTALFVLWGSSEALCSSLNLVQTIPDALPYEDVAVSPDGAHVYATGSSYVSVFDRDAATGLLSVQNPLSQVPSVDGGKVAVSPDGAYVYVLSGDTRKLVAFGRNPATGALTLTAHYDDPADSPGFTRYPTAIALSADGASIYVTGRSSPSPDECGAVTAYDRNNGDGTLTLVETEVLGGDACYGAGAVAISPEGTSVYVTTPNRIQVYARNAGDGSLTAQSLVDPGFLHDDGSDIAVAPGGDNVYVATDRGVRDTCYGSCPSASFNVFARDLAGGLTALEETVQKKGLRAVAVDGAGTHVIFATAYGRALLYARDANDGSLDLRDSFAGPSSDSLGLDLSPDGRHAYANIGHELFVLQLTCGDGVVDPGEECDDGDNEEGDGCSPHCDVENCWSCAGAPSACAPFIDGTACDDGNLCTIADVCSAGACTGAAEPDPGCRVPGKAALSMKAARSEKVVWKWSRGDDTPLEALGDPTTTTDYAICIYDQSARPQPISRLEPQRYCASAPWSCWRSVGADGFVYTDESGYPVRSITLRPGVGGKARILVKATSFGDILDPWPTLPFTAPVTVQLRSSDGECWQSTHSVPSVNTETKFSAR